MLIQRDSIRGIISKTVIGLIACLPLASVQAASVTYSLTLSSDDLLHISGTGFVSGNLPSGVEYATVTVEDGSGATAGMIDFTVSLSSFWTGNEGTAGKWGIGSFGFNVVDNTLTAADPSTEIINLPATQNGGSGVWAGVVDYVGPQNQNGWGSFDSVVSYSGSKAADQRQATALTFSIVDTGDTIDSYFDGSVAGSNGSQAFAVHIAGFADQNTGEGCYEESGECVPLVSAWFAGPATVIPVPAAAWLFGSALGLLGWMRRRQN